MPAAYLKAPEINMAQTGCRKIRFENRRWAEHAKQSTRRRNTVGLTQHGSGHLIAYHCRYCDGWHLGHLGVH